jgi:hypothetical protein
LQNVHTSTTILRKGPFAIVLRDRPRDSDRSLLPASAQVVIDRRCIEDDGYTCITGRLGPMDVKASIDGLKADLDALVDETLFAIVARAADRFESRRFANDNMHGQAS